MNSVDSPEKEQEKSYTAEELIQFTGKMQSNPLSDEMYQLLENNNSFTKEITGVFNQANVSLEELPPITPSLENLNPPYTPEWENLTLEYSSKLDSSKKADKDLMKVFNLEELVIKAKEKNSFRL